MSRRVLRYLHSTGAWVLWIGLLLQRGAAVETPTGPLPLKIPTPTNNPATTQRIALGRLLFFDPILSESKDVSCATCHNPKHAWTDGRATPIGIGGIGQGPRRHFRATAPIPLITRNVPTLLNIAFHGTTNAMPAIPEEAPMFWDARVRSLERQVSIPLSTAGEMSVNDSTPDSALEQAVQRLAGIPEYDRLFREAFGPLASNSRSINSQRLAQAIAAFERSLAGSGSRFDRFKQGDSSALGSRERRGAERFQKAGCLHCHGGPMFSDFALHELGLGDDAHAIPGRFRTPSLRNVARTAPYMHDGRYHTLRQVLVFYDELQERVTETLEGGDQKTEPRLDPLLRHLNIGPEDFEDIEAFLTTLNDEVYEHRFPDCVPSGLPVLMDEP